MAHEAQKEGPSSDREGLSSSREGLSSSRKGLDEDSVRGGRADLDAVVGSGDEAEQQKLGARLREAREYVGLIQADVARALDIPRASVSTIESGKRRVTSLELRRFARLYRRPVGWLLGEDTEIDLAEPLFRATAALSENDKRQVLRFAEFLAGAGSPATPNRKDREDSSDDDSNR